MTGNQRKMIEEVLKMPRGKLHYEAYQDGDQYIEHWKDTHGHDHIQVSYIHDDDDDDIDGIPFGCSACGGDWPNCTSSCPMYDN